MNRAAQAGFHHFLWAVGLFRRLAFRANDGSSMLDPYNGCGVRGRGRGRSTLGRRPMVTGWYPRWYPASHVDDLPLGHEPQYRLAFHLSILHRITLPAIVTIPF